MPDNPVTKPPFTVYETSTVPPFSAVEQMLEISYHAYYRAVQANRPDASRYKFMYNAQCEIARGAGLDDADFARIQDIVEKRLAGA